MMINRDRFINFLIDGPGGRRKLAPPPASFATVPGPFRRRHNGRLPIQGVTPRCVRARAG